LASSCGELDEPKFVLLRESIMPRQRAERDDRVPDIIAKVRRPALNIRTVEIRIIINLTPEISTVA
jgi:hypothetical protein